MSEGGEYGWDLFSLSVTHGQSRMVSHNHMGGENISYHS